MATFIEDPKNTSPVRAALKIKWATEQIVIPTMKKHYPSTDYVLKHAVAPIRVTSLSENGGSRS